MLFCAGGGVSLSWSLSGGRGLRKGWVADHLKLVFPMAWSVTSMAWAMRDGRRLLTHTHFDGSSNWEWGMQTLEYGVNFLLNCDFGNGEFLAQVRTSQ